MAKKILEDELICKFNKIKPKTSLVVFMTTGY